MELILAGGFVFWALIGIIAIAMVWGIEEESNFLTFTALVVGSVALWLITGMHHIDMSWLTHNWDYVALGVLGYIVSGSLWGIMKWWFFLHNGADDYEAHRTQYQTDYKAWSDDWTKTITDRRVKEPAYADPRSYTSYKDYIQEKYHYPPLPAANKSRIMLWMVWWPWSALWTLLNDPLKRIYRMIYQHLVSIYTRMSYAVFGGRFDELK
jgi:hypothetical protein